MESNFIALVPGFKLESHPTFILTCDPVGLRWLLESFLKLVDTKPAVSFVIGDGSPITSDDRCRLTVSKVHNRQASEIVSSDQWNFIWYIGQTYVEDVAAQLASLLSSDVSGHQYLEVKQGNYRTVVITKCEYPVDTIRAMRDARSRP